MKIYVIGDSTAFPIDMQARATWPSHLQNHGHLVFTNIIPGNTISRFTRLSQRHFIEEPFDLIIFNIGLPDYIFPKLGMKEFVEKRLKEKIKLLRKQKLRSIRSNLNYRLSSLILFTMRSKEGYEAQTSLQEFSSSFTQAVKYAEQYTQNIIFISPPPGNAYYHKKFDKKLGGKGAYETLRNEYYKIIKQLSKTHHFIDITNYTDIDYHEDGFHYSDKTHAKIAKALNHHIQNIDT